MVKVNVTQKARKAAVALMKDQKPLYSEQDYIDDILAGENDSNAIVQAFANYEKDLRRDLTQQQKSIDLIGKILQRISSLSDKELAVTILEKHGMINRAWYDIMIACMKDYAKCVSLMMLEDNPIMPKLPSDEMIQAASQTPGMKAIDNVLVIAGARGHRFSDEQCIPAPLVQAWTAMREMLLNKKD